MGETFDKLMKMLNEKGEISDDEIKKVVEESGAMSEEEMIEFSLAQVKKGETKITMEQYLEASKVLDAAAEGSPEYQAALKIVEEYEKG